MNRSFPTRRVCFVAGALIAGSIAGGTVVSAQRNVRLTCLPDKAVALPADTVAVTVWAASDTGPVTASVDVQWRVSAGQIAGRSMSASWVLQGAPVERRHTATAEVSVNGIPAGTCELGVWVAEPAASGAPVPGGGGSNLQLRGEYVTRRAFIRSQQAGDAGFGLYSYFLLREPSTPRDRARATAFVRAFLDVLVGVADQENYVERRRLNGSYMPVTEDLPQRLTPEQRTAWATDHYDYEHAKRLLSLYPGLTGPGPFILAVPAPLRAPVRPMLPWDFTQVDDMDMPAGVSRFLNQAAQLYDWQNQSALDTLRDHLLTPVAGMFVGRSAAENWMPIVR